jgi:hypothetical protein
MRAWPPEAGEAENFVAPASLLPLVPSLVSAQLVTVLANMVFASRQEVLT